MFGGVLQGRGSLVVLAWCGHVRWVRAAGVIGSGRLRAAAGIIGGMRRVGICMFSGLLIDSLQSDRLRFSIYGVKSIDRGGPCPELEPLHV